MRAFTPMSPAKYSPYWSTLRSNGAEGFLLLDQTPLYPYTLGILSFFFGDNVLLLRLVTVLAGLGTIILAYNIGFRLRGPISGLVAALLLAINPFFILFFSFLFGWRSFYVSFYCSPPTFS